MNRTINGRVINGCIPQDCRIDVLPREEVEFGVDLEANFRLHAINLPDWLELRSVRSAQLTGTVYTESYEHPELRPRLVGDRRLWFVEAAPTHIYNRLAAVAVSTIDEAKCPIYVTWLGEVIK